MDGAMFEDSVGCKVALVTTSRLRLPFVPFNEVTIYSLYPDFRFFVKRRHGERSSRSSHPSYRLARIRLRLDESGRRIVGKCTKWWELSELLSGGVDGRKWGAAKHSADLLSRAIQRQPSSLLGMDLPIYLDQSANPASLARNWDVLEWDVFRGMNGEFPFQWSLDDPAEEQKIRSEIPFVDVAEHFRSIVADGDTMIALTRMLIAQRQPSVHGMSLVPLRWVSEVNRDSVVVVRTGEVRIIDFPDPNRLRVEIGSMRVPLDRSRDVLVR